MTRNPVANNPEAQRRASRVIAFALWIVVWVYVILYASQVLKGDLSRFLAPIGDAPWRNPILLALCGLAVLLPAPAFVMRGVLMARAANTHDPSLRVGLERVAMIVTMALFESVGIWGLVLGFVLGPARPPVSGLMFLVPLVAIPLLLPPHARFGGGDGDGPLRPS